MDLRSRRKFVNSMMAATAMAMGGPMLMGQDTAQAAPASRQTRPKRPRPAGIVWISGQGSNDGVPADKKIPLTAPFRQHVTMTMDAVKRAVEKLGGTMDSVLYMQVFFCLPLADGTPAPTGSAAAAAYQERYMELNAIYNTYWTGTYGPPPRSCFALSWIPGNSLIEIVGAAYFDDGDA